MLRVLNLATIVFWISGPLFAAALALGWPLALPMWPVLISSAILAYAAYYSASHSKTMRKDERVIYSATFLVVLCSVAAHVLP